MNPFQKNPFVNNKNAKIVGYNPEFSEKNKLEKIKMDMTKLKYDRPEEESKKQKKEMTINEKINSLKNINRQ